MKMFPISLLVFALSLASPLAAQEPPAWTNTAGVTIRGDFVRLDGQAVVIHKDGKEFTIPFSNLTGDSIVQAEKLAAAMPESAEDAESVAFASSFGKQNDPEHQRKLAESIVSKGGTVEIWRGSGQVSVGKTEELPKGRLSLKSVDAAGQPFSDEDAALLNGCRELTRLRIQRSTLEDLPLESLPALENLEIHECRIGAAALRGLAGSKRLKRLQISLHQGPIDKEVFETISTCPNLEVLNLNRAGLGGAGLQSLLKLRNLRSLHLDGNKLGDAELSVLAGLPALNQLALSSTDFSDQTLGFLPSLKLVRNLDLGECKLPEGAMEKFSAMPSLKILQLFGSDITAESLRGLAGMKGLSELLLENTTISAEDFSGLKAMPSVKRLHLYRDGVVVTDAGAAAITAVFPALEALLIDAKQLGSPGIESLAGLGLLTELRLMGASAFDESAADALARMKRLAILDLNGSSLADAHFARLEPLKGRLRELHIGNTRISDASVEAVLKLKSLQVLSIRGTDISGKAVETIRDALRGCDVRY